MKRIKIFLASSSELKADRDAFEIFIGRENKKLTKEGKFLELVIWEDFLDALAPHGLQEEYNKAIRDSDIFVMLYFTKVGKNTLEEFEAAIGAFHEGGKPLIYTFFKDSTLSVGSVNLDDLESLWAFQEKLHSLKHFQSIYANGDELQWKFRRQLDWYFESLTESGIQPFAAGGEPKQVHSGTGDNVGGDKIGNQIIAGTIGHHFHQVIVPALHISNKLPKSRAHSIGIVLLGANPDNHPRLAIRREFKLLKDVVDRCKKVPRLKVLDSDENVTMQGIVKAVSMRPDIIHFSGNGTEKGIFVLGDDDLGHLLPIASVVLFFKPLGGKAKVAFFNACNTSLLANEISKLGMYAIGYGISISDADAIFFAEGFYFSLGHGNPIEDGFRDGLAMTMTRSPGFRSAIELWKNGQRIEI